MRVTLKNPTICKMARRDSKYRAGLRLAVVVIAGVPAFGTAQVQTCKLGQAVSDERNNAGVIVAERDDQCLIKFNDGQTQAWISAKQLKIGVPANSAGAPAAAAPASVVTLRPTSINRLEYRADALGHFVLTAKLNNAPVRFLVDTGATLVSLTPEDAKAAGLNRSELTFNQTVQTGNGPVRAAFAQLREIRIGQLEVNQVPVAVIETLKQSVLGMSFLSRVKAFEMRDGTLTITW